MYNRQQQNGAPLPPILEEQISFPITQVVFALREGKTVKVALKTKDGYFLSAVNGGGGSVVANAAQIGPNEIFLLIPQGPNRDKVAIRTVNKNYISAINGGGATVDARSTTLGLNELFNLIAIRPDQGSFTTARGFYLLTYDTEPRLLTGYGVVQGPRTIYTIIAQAQ